MKNEFEIKNYVSDTTLGLMHRTEIVMFKFLLSADNSPALNFLSALTAETANWYTGSDYVDHNESLLICYLVS